MNLQLETINNDNQRLAWHFQVSRTSCGHPEYYESFLKFSALSDFNSGYSTTHLLIDREHERIAGFFSLRMSALASRDDTGHLIINLPEYKSK